MYKHYETSDDVFVDREEHIKWMNDALERCKEKSVVLHLKGVGGIGKSSLLSHWVNTHEKTIRLDCEQYSEFYQRLNMLAKGAVLQGVKLQRFDILWQIRQRFVEGVEPVREEGREWAKEVVMAIPFIGSLASIGSAISAVGSKVTPKLKGKYSTIGKWLQETLGKNHIEQLLEILWKDPRRAEFLYLSAFLEDINNRDNLDTPIIILLDHFEFVDTDKTQWRYSGRRITETELWTLFLTLLSSCVGVMASRRAAVRRSELQIEETELLELDRDSSFEMLELQGVIDESLQEQIVSVSGGNPFVIDVICDMIDTSNLSVSDIEDLRADTLAKVRLKVWRRLFSEAEGLQNLINRAGIVPFFDERIMSIIAPELTPDSWDRLKRLSFVVMRDDGTFVLHDLAEELVRAELGQKMDSIVDEVSGLLEGKYDEVKDIKLKGLALSVKSLKQPKTILNELHEIFESLAWTGHYADGLALCEATKFHTEEGKTFLKLLRAWFLLFLLRVADGEHLMREALDEFNGMSGISEIERLRYRALSTQSLASLLMYTNRDEEATEKYEEAISLLKLVEKNPPEHISPGEINWELVRSLSWYADHHIQLKNLKQAEKAYLDAIDQWESWKKKTENPQSEYGTRWLSQILIGLCDTYRFTGNLVEAENTCRRALKDTKELSVKLDCYDRLSQILMSLNRPTDALEFARNVEELVGKFPKEFPILLRAHFVSLRTKHGIGSYSEALVEAEKALGISRELMEKSPEMHTPSVAVSRRSQALLLRQTGRLEEAEEAYLEALHLRRLLAENSPAGHESVFAWTLNDRGVLLNKTGRNSRAMKEYSEGLEISRRVAEQHPEYLPNIKCICYILNNLGVLHFEDRRLEEAREKFEASLELCSQPSSVSIEMFLKERATILNNLGALLASREEFSDAEEVLIEALNIREELEKTGIAYHLVQVSSTLNNLGLLRMKKQEISQASDLFQRATEKLDQITSTSSLDCKDDLRKVLSNQYILLSKIDSNMKRADVISKRLNELGVKKVTSEEWILDAMESS